MPILGCIKLDEVFLLPLPRRPIPGITPPCESLLSRSHNGCPRLSVVKTNIQKNENLGFDLTPRTNVSHLADVHRQDRSGSIPGYQ